MNYWKSSESNPLKIIIVIVLLGLAGYFIYAASHKDALQNTAQVKSNVSATTSTFGAGTTTGSTPGGTGTKDQKESCRDGALVTSLVPALGPAIPVTNVTTATGVGGHNLARGIYTLKNVGDCPVKLTDLSFVIHTNFINSWTPMQNARAVVGTTAFGPMVPFPSTDTTLCAGSNARCVLTFTNPAGYVIPQGVTVQVRVLSDALNIATPTPSGAPVWFNLQFQSFTIHDMVIPSAYTWRASATAAPITAATITVH